MKFIPSVFLPTLLSVLLLSGCSSKQYSYSISHPTISADNLETELEKTINQCEVQAYNNVKIPRARQSRSSYSPSKVPDATSMIAGFESARNDPRAIYKQRIKSYTMACVKANGWTITKDE